MSDTGLIVFLPLVGAILGAIVGAFGGAWANSWYRNRETKTLQDREMKALLLLVDVEIWANDEKLEVCIEQDNFDPFAVAGLRTDAWDTSKARLAELTELIGVPHFDSMVTYYEMVRKVQDATRTYSEHVQNKGFFAAMSGTIQNARSMGSIVRQDSRRHLPDYRYRFFRIPPPKDPARDEPVP